MMVVPALPASGACVSARAPMVAGCPVAVTNRRHASILGPIDPAGITMLLSESGSRVVSGVVSDVP